MIRARKGWMVALYSATILANGFMAGILWQLSTLDVWTSLQLGCYLTLVASVWLSVAKERFPKYLVWAYAVSVLCLIASGVFRGVSGAFVRSRESRVGITVWQVR